MSDPDVPQSDKPAPDTADTIGGLLREAKQRLSAACNESAALESRILLAGILNKAAGLLPALGPEPVSAEHADRLRAMIDRRLKGEPVYRILGSKEFMGREFLFSGACLEPRPETELLVERILEDIPAGSGGRFADIGCGSGVIAITLLCERPLLEGVATDIEHDAIRQTLDNAKGLGVGSRLEVLHTPFLAGVAGRFDFIVSNPPYIPTREIDGLQVEVREHDPALALDGGEDGLDAYRAILDMARAFLPPGGLLYLETGDGQHSAICEEGRKMGWGRRSTHLDLSGRERIVVLELT